MQPSLEQLSLREKIGQMFFIGIPGPEIDDLTADLLDEISPGGICLFARNIKGPVQVRNLLDGIRERLPIEPFLSLDQEGGLVDRLRRIMEPMPPASALRGPEDAAELARIAAETVRMLGFNMNFAPVIDVIDEGRASRSNGLYSRSFGNSADEVNEMADAFLETLQNGGCLGCIKHFPGLGAARSDSHVELPVVDISEEELRNTDLAPYRHFFSSGSAKAVMVAHAAYPNTNLQETDVNGKLLPSSLSFAFVTTLLREEMRFDGLVLTDDLEMGAIENNYGIGEAGVMAVLAGHDMLCICAGVESIRTSFAAVEKAFMDGRISVERIDRSVSRILAARSGLSGPLELDPERLSELSNDIKQLKSSLNT